MRVENAAHAVEVSTVEAPLLSMSGPGGMRHALVRRRAPPLRIPVAVQPPGSAVELERMQQRHEEEVASLRALLEHRTQLVRRNARRLRSAGCGIYAARAGAAVRASCSGRAADHRGRTRRDEDSARAARAV